MSIDITDRPAAELIAADPAFAALDAAGTPILVARVEPFCVVHVNAAARKVLVDPETIRRLFVHAWPEKFQSPARAHTTLDASVRGVGPRLERAILEIDGESQGLTLFCQEFRELLMLAAPGFRPAAATDPTSTAALRSHVGSRSGASSIRFLWKTNAYDQFVAVDPTLADVVGEARNLVGASVEEIARDIGGGDEWIRAIASRRSWSGVRVEWPLADAEGVAPITLGALPCVDDRQSFAGYNGYGLIHLSRIRATARSPDEPTDVNPLARRGANVVPLRPTRAASLRHDPPAPPEAAFSDQAQLTESELSAFAEIARTLGNEEASALNSRDPPPQRPVADQAAVTVPSTGATATALDLLPIGVLVARGTQTLFANRALLSDMGYADSAAFANDGGLARIFMGRLSRTTGAHSDDLDAHVETIDWAGAPATMISLMRGSWAHNLKDRNELETKLARARSDNAMLRALIDALEDAVAIIDEDGRIESATTAFATQLGADKGALDGLSVSSTILPEDAPQLLARLQRAEIGAPQIFMFNPRQGQQTLEAVIGRLPVGVAKIYLRLSKPAAAAAAELVAARQAAERASAAKSDFVARISHEIRTPLNAIIGFADIMREERFGPVGSRKYKDYLKDIHASGAHVLSLVNDLLDLSKIEAGKLDLRMDAVDANIIITECMSIMQPQANGRRVVMRQALAPTLPTIYADSRALRQILLNLLSNAVKFTPGGGQVIVSSALADAGRVVVRIKDTGVGMSEDEVQTALEPFTQIAPETDARGSGLGLPLTKALVEASGGSLTIQSRREAGTLVEIAFPSTAIQAAE